MKNKVIKLFAFLLAISIVLFGNINVNAAECGVEKRAELIREAENVKAIYTPHIDICEPNDECYNKYKAGGPNEVLFDNPGEYYPIIEDMYLTLEVLNVNENFKVKVGHSNTNTFGEIPSEIKYSDIKNGKFSFDVSASDKVDKFSFTVVGSKESGCENERLRVIDLTLPQINLYYNYPDCEGIEDYYLCQPFVSYIDTNLDTMTYMKKINTEKTKRGIAIDVDNPDDVKESDNKILLPVMIAISGAAVIAAGVIIMKGRKRG